MKTVNIDGQQYVPTPLGLFPHVSNFQSIASYAGIRWSEENQDWVYVSEKVRINDEEIWLPIRAYNFEYGLYEVMKSDSMQRITSNVIKKVMAKDYGNSYLPSIKGFSSYSKLLESIEA